MLQIVIVYHCHWPSLIRAVGTPAAALKEPDVVQTETRRRRLASLW
ncbi:hypothetical protein SODG_002559 [Sodalis praecaptivus]|nr:hypothetical protein NVIRENTERO_02561 [Sodalis praecaptivus]